MSSELPPPPARQEPALAAAAPAGKLTLADMLKFKSLWDLDLDANISLKNKYVYMMVSKAASSTVTYHLQRAEYLGTPYVVKNVNDRHRSPHVAPFQLTKRHFAAIMSNDKFRKVTMVRNPYSRLLSCYLHRIVGTDRMNPSKKVLARYAGGREFAAIGFAEFIAIVTDQESREMERHWAVQHDAIMYPLVRYDFVGKQESLVEDLLRMEALLFGREVFERDKLATLNLAPMQTASTAKVREYYTDRLAARVADRYRLDFETFGYSTDPAEVARAGPDTRGALPSRQAEGEMPQRV